MAWASEPSRKHQMNRTLLSLPANAVVASGRVQ